METWNIGNIEVTIGLSQPEDIDLGLVLKSKEIPLPGPFLNLSPEGNVHGKSVAIQDESADEVMHWPSLSIRDRNRRGDIQRKAKEALTKATEEQYSILAFFTAGLESAGVPPWEIAEEITKAIDSVAQKETTVRNVLIIAGTDVQISSFQYTLSNPKVIFSRE